MTVRMKAGRSWSVDSTGINSLSRVYQIEIDGDYLGPDAEAAAFSGIPAIGSAHPLLPYLKVAGYDVSEGEGSDKRLLTVTVKYESSISEEVSDGETKVTGAVEDYGWDEGMDERELITAVNGVALVNSAGDPFDAVPRVSVPAPTFTKVIKTPTRMSGWADSFCRINDGAITVGGINCAKWTLLCNVSEKRIFGDPNFMYRYTVRLRYRSNLVKLYGSGNAQEIGWNVSVTDTGMRQLGADGKPVVIRQKDAETGRMLTITSPELLDGEGHAVDRSSGTAPEPYNGFFQAYQEATFPGWFYSEPMV